MADVQKAIDFVINLEDDKQHPGAITQLAGDAGGKTRLGVASRFHPELVKQGFFDGDPIEGTNPLRWEPTTINKDKGRQIAEIVYQSGYAAPLAVDKIADQDLANHVLSFGVNMGNSQAATLLQRAIPLVPQDGVIGPRTLAAVDGCDPKDLTERLKDEAGMFYKHVAENNSALAPYARGMQNRANA